MAPEGDEIKERVKEIVLDHRGADDPISSREINERIGVDSIGSFPATRDVVRELVLEDRIPIAATNQGYFVIETEDELAEYIENLEDRILGISEWKFAIRRAAHDWAGEIQPSDDADLL